MRWDRLGRVALLTVLVVVAALYVGPARSYLATWHTAKQKRSEVRALERERTRLRARARALHDPATIEREARELGMIRADERAYVVQGLPR